MSLQPITLVSIGSHLVCGSVVASSGFDLCLKHKMLYKKAMVIHVHRHSLPVRARDGFLKLKRNVCYSRELVWFVER